MRRWSRERLEKRENKRPISKRLRAALLWSFRGSKAEKWFVWGSPRDNWGTREDQQPFRPNPNGVGESTTTLRRLLIGSVQFCSLYILYIRQKFRTLLFRKIESIRILGTNRKSVIMIGVKVNSKSELIEDREGKSALYRCNLLL